MLYNYGVVLVLTGYKKQVIHYVSPVVCLTLYMSGWEYFTKETEGAADLFCDQKNEQLVFERQTKKYQVKPLSLIIMNDNNYKIPKLW